MINIKIIKLKIYIKMIISYDNITYIYSSFYFNPAYVFII